MKEQFIKIRVFKAGDRVITSEGYGTIINDNINELGDGFYNDLGFQHQVVVQHDEGLSANPSNEPRTMNANEPGLLLPGHKGDTNQKGV